MSEHESTAESRSTRRVMMPNQPELVNKLVEVLPPQFSPTEDLFFSRFIKKIANKLVTGKRLLSAWILAGFEDITDQNSLIPADIRRKLDAQFNTIIAAITPDPGVAADAIAAMRKLQEQQSSRSAE